MFEQVNPIEENFPKQRIQIQIKLGLIGIFFLMASTVFFVISISLYWNDPMYPFFTVLQENTGVTGAAFLVVGNIGILQKNGSELGWLLLVVYVIGWIMHYAYFYVIFPLLAQLEIVDFAFALSVVSNIYNFFIRIIILIAWLSIHERVSNRVVFFSFLILSSLDIILINLVTGILFGFEGVSVTTFEEAFLYHSPHLVIMLITSLVLLLFYITELKSQEPERYDYTFD